MRWVALLLPLCCSCSSDDALNTEGYKIASDLLTKSINFSVDPCEDFFEYSCGNWIASHPIPSHRTSYSHASLLTDKVQKDMKGLFESPEVFQSNVMMMLKMMYRKCTDMEEINRLGARQLLNFLEQRSVIWPMLHGDDKWQPKDYNLTALMKLMSARAVHAFVTFDATPDERNVSRRILRFSQIDLGLGESTRDYYLDKEHEKKIEAYKKRMISEMRLLHEDANLTFNETKTADDVDEIVKFETKLAKITVPEEDRRNHTALYNLRHLSDMQQLMPLVNWMEYLHDYAPSEVHDYLASNPEIIIEDINYIKNITDLLKSTEPRIITNYMLLIFAWNWIDEFGDRYEDVHQEFSHVMVGREKKRPRWERCLSSLTEIPKYATGALFVKKFFNKNTKKAMEEMALEMQEVLQEMLSENEWMDDNTKKTALDKVSKMLIHVAYPDFILDDKKVDEYYKEISLKETDSFSDMVTKLEKWDSNFSMKRLLKPVDRNEFEMNPSEVNAYYCGECNTMAIPAAQLQAPFFHATFPWSLNYGAMGSLIGHEMFHGFDDEGRQYDSIGNLHDWWSDEALEKFVNRSQCFIDQYGNIKVPGTGLKVNGKMTQGENIADSGGVKQAYKAYKRYLKKHGEEKRAKGLEQISDEQMFFIGYATSWCGNERQDFLINLLLTDPHAPVRYRVNQVLANQPEFAAAFKCAVGTPMNPKERCAVW